MTVLDNLWLRWIDDNLARGCNFSSMVDAMVRAGFDAPFANQSIQQRATGGSVQMASASVAQPGLGAAQSGPYIYEAPRLQHKGNVLQTQDLAVRLAFRMAQPVVALLDNLLTEHECDELVELARIKLQRSTIIDPSTGREAVIQDRSSSGTFFQINENALVATLDRRIAEVMHCPVENGEGIQILHYAQGGEYKPHFDFFPPSDAGSQVHLAKGGQRVSTLVMYLNDVEAGGETVFPKLQLSVVPKKGSAVYFEYCNSLGQVDPQTLHGGLPVTAGEKWIATKWMRQRQYG
jgi:prolyl 4-hydroxylase